VGLLLGVSALALSSFILALVYFDLSPRTFLYKMMKRFFPPPESLRPALRDAPYRQLRARRGLHQPVLLNLETSDGSGQACHPDVAYIAEGFGSKKWPYWMVCTPYPYGDDSFENPEVFVSFDGINWEIPEGLYNPIVPSPKKVGDHHSDAELVFCRGQLFLFYRLTLRSIAPRETPSVNKLYLMKSVDGIGWSGPVEILADNAGAELLSPAVVYDGTSFLMWTVENIAGQLKVMRRSSSDALHWSAPTSASVRGLVGGRFPWHIDAIQDEDGLSAVLVSCTALGGSQSRIHYAHSEDLGLTWVAGGFLFEQAYEFESKIQYRATLRALQTAGGDREYELWYSSASLSDVFSIAYLKVMRAGHQLVPSKRARRDEPRDVPVLVPHSPPKARQAAG
jgi:hypothetical protein